jgi:hypothetical protein
MARNRPRVPATPPPPKSSLAEALEALAHPERAIGIDSFPGQPASGSGAPPIDVQPEPAPPPSPATPTVTTPISSVAAPPGAAPAGPPGLGGPGAFPPMSPPPSGAPPTVSLTFSVQTLAWFALVVGLLGVALGLYAVFGLRAEIDRLHETTEAVRLTQVALDKRIIEWKLGSPDEDAANNGSARPKGKSARPTNPRGPGDEDPSDDAGDAGDAGDDDDAADDESAEGVADGRGSARANRPSIRQPTPGLLAAASVDPTPKTPDRTMTMPRSAALTLIEDTKQLSTAKARDHADPVGVELVSVPDTSIYARAGLKAGDIVTSVDGTPLFSADRLPALREILRLELADQKATVRYTFIRNGAPMLGELRITGDTTPPKPATP